jgi:hypothetical protein
MQQKRSLAVAPETWVCADCGTAFGSKWARTDHEKICAVRQSVELRRIQEQLEWKRARIERWVQESYTSAARAFAAYHNGNTVLGQRLHKWLAEDFDSTVRDLEVLSQGISQVGKTHYPRVAKLRSDVGLLVEQTKDLTSILETLNRIQGVPQ